MAAGAQVLAEASQSGVRVRNVARRHGICTSPIYRWRCVAAGVVGAAPLARLVPVRIAQPSLTDPRTSDPAAMHAPPRSDGIEIDLSNGNRLRVSGETTTAALRRVMAALHG